MRYALIAILSFVQTSAAGTHVWHHALCTDVEAPACSRCFDEAGPACPSDGDDDHQHSDWHECGDCLVCNAPDPIWSVRSNTMRADDPGAALLPVEGEADVVLELAIGPVSAATHSPPTTFHSLSLPLLN